MTTIIENTLETEIVFDLIKARHIIKKAMENTRHNNRDTQTLPIIYDKLDFIIKANSKELI